jgi:hypothetical protein
VALLKADNLDADMLNERARLLLDYADPHDLILLIEPRARPVEAIQSNSP